MQKFDQASGLIQQPPLLAAGIAVHVIAVAHVPSGLPGEA